MKLSDKLNALQIMATEHEEEPYKLFFIRSLAEYIEEDEITADFLAWVRSFLKMPL